jgi:hypothetical protein
VVFSHFHGDHVPLLNANPYQLSVREFLSSFSQLCCWSKSNADLSFAMSTRFEDLANLCGTQMQTAENQSEGPLAFSPAVSHGAPESGLGTLMMTRIETDKEIFVHASDIQLLDDETVDRVVNWRPDIVLAAGPPSYLTRLDDVMRKIAWNNAVRLAQNIETVILDHHLMRTEKGSAWLDRLSATVGKKVCCAADYMEQPRRLLEAKRENYI